MNAKKNEHSFTCPECGSHLFASSSRQLPNGELDIYQVECRGDEEGTGCRRRGPYAEYVEKARAEFAIDKNDWKLMSESPPPNGQVVLLYHEDDLYPVVGFCFRSYFEDYYMAQREGPEDGDHQDYRSLYRTPTHWRDLPEWPQKTTTTGCRI